MKKSLLSSTALALTLLSSHANAQQVPNIFSPNTPAVAAEVNENFAYITDQLSALSSSPAGEVSVDIDCTDNPGALNEAYLENASVQDLNFFIVGECYGDIELDFNSIDGDGNWDGTYEFNIGKVINIRPQEGQTASLIPHNISGRAVVYGGFGGGLYLNDLTITMGENDFSAVFYSRNSQGSVVNTTIVGTDALSGNAITVQEGAQLYINGVNVSNTNVGVSATNNGVIRFLGEPSTFENVNNGVRLITSVARSQAPVNITANGNSIELYGASTWNAFGQDVNIESGRIVLSTNSAFQAQNLTAGGSSMDLNTSVVEVAGTLELGDFYSQMSKLFANAGGIDGQVTLVDGSSVVFNGTEETKFSLENITLERNSVAQLNNVSVVENVNVWWDSTLNFENSSANYLYAESSSVRGFNVEISNIDANNTAFIEIDTLTEADTVTANSSAITLRNANLSGNVRGFTNSTINVDSSEVNGFEVGRSSAAVLSNITVRGESSVVDFLDASIWVTRSSTLAIFGSALINEGALPIDIEALSFFEGSFDEGQTFNNVEVRCSQNSVVYAPENADITFNGCN